MSTQDYNRIVFHKTIGFWGQLLEHWPQLVRQWKLPSNIHCAHWNWHHYSWISSSCFVQKCIYPASNAAQWLDIINGMAFKRRQIFAPACHRMLQWHSLQCCILFLLSLAKYFQLANMRFWHWFHQLVQCWIFTSQLDDNNHKMANRLALYQLWFPIGNHLRVPEIIFWTKLDFNFDLGMGEYLCSYWPMVNRYWKCGWFQSNF